MDTPSPASPEDAARRLLIFLRNPTRLLVAISGGSDSTGLLVSLKHALADCGISHSLVAATVDHALRPGSSDEAQAVARLCASLDIPHRILTWHGAKPTTGISAAAREARYRLLADAAADFGATAIVTGHTADDQDETIAMRAARAEDDNLGLSGMAEAMLYDRRIWVLRPFLAVRRQTIRDYLSSTGLGWIDDPSNADRRYERVRIRQDRGTATRPLGVEAAERRRRLSRDAAELIAHRATLHAGCLIALAPDALDAKPPILRHALATLVAVAGGRPHRPGTAAMDRLIDFVASGSPGRMTLARTLVQRRRDGLYLMRELRDVLPRQIPPHASMLWDGRFRVTNRTGQVLQVEPRSEPLPSSVVGVLPPSMQRHIARISPQIWTVGDTETGADETSVQAMVEPAFPLFDLFLADSDLALADAVARLFGRKAYLPPPA
ncbi:MAG: tRNA lysidine(34) synthetase TilS [Rhizobium sp.]|nr:tRNA lysidine(34) synthetase TilS [Rhizobium sp.]